MMGRRQKLKGGDEWDVCSKRARRLLCYLSKAGATKQAKRRMNRRARAEIRQRIMARTVKTRQYLYENGD